MASKPRPTRRPHAAAPTATAPALQADVAVLLRRARRDAGLSLEALARHSGCSKAYLSLVESGQRSLSPTRAAAIERTLRLADAPLQRAIDWQRLPKAIREELVRARTRSGAASVHRAPARRVHDRAAAVGAAAAIELGSLRPIPIINSVAAGPPREFTDLDYPRSMRGGPVADHSLTCPGISDPDAFAARIEGDSMEPDYCAGDVVVFSPGSAITPSGGVDCFVRLERDAESTFKRVYFEQRGRVIRLQPLNSAYPPRTLAREEVTGLYPAVYVLRRIRRVR